MRVHWVEREESNWEYATSLGSFHQEASLPIRTLMPWRAMGEVGIQQVMLFWVGDSTKNGIRNFCLSGLTIKNCSFPNERTKQKENKNQAGIITKLNLMAQFQPTFQHWQSCAACAIWGVCSPEGVLKVRQCLFSYLGVASPLPQIGKLKCP